MLPLDDNQIRMTSNSEKKSSWSHTLWELIVGFEWLKTKMLDWLPIRIPHRSICIYVSIINCMLSSCDLEIEQKSYNPESDIIVAFDFDTVCPCLSELTNHPYQFVHGKKNCWPMMSDPQKVSWAHMTLNTQQIQKRTNI